MMNSDYYMIIDRESQRIITSSIEFCKFDFRTNKYAVRYTSGKTYYYSAARIAFLEKPKLLMPDQYSITYQGKELFAIKSIRVFADGSKKYWHICFNDNSFRDYSEQDLTIDKSCLDDAFVRNVFDYLKKIADLVSLKTDEGVKLLSKQYEKAGTFVSDKTVLPAYLEPTKLVQTDNKPSTPIFPFGCNASQYKAVKAALENRLSVIEGPPGTGKTQTILNIIANLLVNGKTVQVVSNNNSATANVLEKLSSEKYGMGFLVAPLGRSDNKKDFINNQSGCYPNISDWENVVPEKDSFDSKIRERSKELNELFGLQEKLAKLKLELLEIKLEERHYKEQSENADNAVLNIKKSLNSEKLLALWNEFQSICDKKKRFTPFYKFKCRFSYGIKNIGSVGNFAAYINGIKSRYYAVKKDELTKEIEAINKKLSSEKADKKLDSFVSDSMKYLKSVLYKKYGGKPYRVVFTEEDLWKNSSDVLKEYPVVLSTTFSSRSSLGKKAIFDYLIMDEASQVDVATGALALSCACNAVIVGDKQQLPNVVDRDTAALTNEIFNRYGVGEAYRFSTNSFLQSICELFPKVPKTLLREHYRCHPKIINFCNKKFYGGNLIVMTEDKGENDVISVLKTVKGDHERDRTNIRQIEAVKEEILPKIEFDNKDIGIIAPYNNQVDALKENLARTGIEVATVHKFQGREKDAVIITTVDDELTDFSDDPYLLNVAVSRAKKKLCLVVSGNEQPKDSNISDLISYIEYNNCTVFESKIRSVFDYLYKHYTESRLEYLKKQKSISEYDSENLMYVLIKDILSEIQRGDLDVICHQPLNMLLRDYSLLDEKEKSYASNNATHLDFLIYNVISKKPILAVEVDGFHYHKEGTKQSERDKLKNHILELYGLPYLRLPTNGSEEKAKIISKLGEILK